LFGFIRKHFHVLSVNIDTGFLDVVVMGEDWFLGLGAKLPSLPSPPPHLRSRPPSPPFSPSLALPSSPFP